jgi:enoyl-CoA hydratase
VLISYDVLDHLRVEIGEGIATVMLAPGDGGPVEPSFFTNLRDVFSLLALDPAVDAVVLTGRGEVFFAGTGVPRTARLVAEGLAATAGQMLTLQQIAQQMLGFRKPLVAAVNGRAPNIGGQIALLCDAAVAAEEASFGDHHIAGGIAAGDGGTMLWPLLVGMARAREILLMGRPIDAGEALDLHLVSAVVPRERLLAEAQALARSLAALPRVAYIATKHSLNNWWRLAMLFSWDLALGLETAGLVTPDYVAGIAGQAAEHGSA